MKRRDLVRQLTAGGGFVTRSRGPQGVSGRGRQRIAVPRHMEVAEYLARKMLREAAIE